jgi:endonuclease/exonuclease/phosphatase family metal-dependent hydrolase
MGRPFKILTYNVHRGRSTFVRRDICERIARILDFSSADVVCLQEVWQDEGFDRHRFETHLCDERWPHRVFSKTVGFRLGVQGNAVVSRAPIRGWDHLDISVPKREPRGMLHATLESGEGPPVHMFCVHFGLARRERRLQVDLLSKFLRERVPADQPLFIAGDFNDWRRDLSSPFATELGLREVTLTTKGKHGATYPSFLPFLSLDRIYFRGCRLLQARIVHDRRCLTLSDHLPVEAHFEL